MRFWLLLTLVAGLVAWWIAFEAPVAAPFSVTVVPVGPPALPTPMLMAWMQGPSAPRLTTVLANAPQYNHIWYFGAYGPDTSGSIVLDLTTYSGTQAQLVSDIATWKTTIDAKGNHRTIGVSIVDCFFQNGTFLTPTNATNAYNSIVSIVNTYGFQGIEWDLESGDGNSGTCWNKSTIDSIDTQLKANFGSGFYITQTPRPFELGPGTAKRGWMSTMDMTEPQYYANSSTTVLCSQVQAWESGAVFNEGMMQFVGGSDGGSTTTANKIVFGNDITSGCVPTDYSVPFQNIQSSYPTLRGAGVWQLIADQGNGWTFATTFGAVLGD